MTDSITERLAEIENRLVLDQDDDADQLDRHAREDVPALLAAVRGVLEVIDEDEATARITVGGGEPAPDLDAVFFVINRVRERLAAALSDTRGGEA